MALEPDLEDWVQWAVVQGMPAELIAFIRFRPKLLSDFAPSVDITNSPCPRTVHNLGRQMQLELPAELEFEAYAGTETMDAMVCFANRLPDEYSVLLITQAVQFCPAIINARAYAKWAAKHHEIMSQLSPFCERRRTMNFDITEKAMLASLQISQWSARKHDKRVSAEVNQKYNGKDAGRFNKILASKASLNTDFLNRHRNIMIDSNGHLKIRFSLASFSHEIFSGKRFQGAFLKIGL